MKHFFLIIICFVVTIWLSIFVIPTAMVDLFVNNNPEYETRQGYIDRMPHETEYEIIKQKHEQQGLNIDKSNAAMFPRVIFTFMSLGFMVLFVKFITSIISKSRTKPASKNSTQKRYVPQYNTSSYSSPNVMFNTQFADEQARLFADEQARLFADEQARFMEYSLKTVTPFEMGGYLQDSAISDNNDSSNNFGNNYNNDFDAGTGNGFDCGGIDNGGFDSF